MKISEEVRQRIDKEFKDWVDEQYAGRSIEERQSLAQFYTPPSMTIQLIENFDTVENKRILDPSSGCGGLLAGCIIAGADPKLVYGVEIDPDIVIVSKKRLGALGVPEENIQLGNSLNKSAYHFDIPSQITNQQSYINRVFTKEAMDLVNNDGWETCRPRLEALIKEANEEKVTLKEVLDIRYRIYDLLSELKQEVGKIDIWKLFPKYDPDEKDMKKRLLQLSKTPQAFILKEDTKMPKVEKRSSPKTKKTNTATKKESLKEKKTERPKEAPPVAVDPVESRRAFFNRIFSESAIEVIPNEIAKKKIRAVITYMGKKGSTLADIEKLSTALYSIIDKLSIPNKGVLFPRYIEHD